MRFEALDCKTNTRREWAIRHYKTLYGIDAQNELPPGDGKGAGSGKRVDSSALLVSGIDLQRKVTGKLA